MSTLFTAFFKLQGANSVPGMHPPRSSPCREAQPWQAAASAQVGFSLLPLPAELWGQLHENRHGFWCKSCLFPIHWHQPRSAMGSKAGREKERCTKMLVCMLLPCGPPFFELKILKCSCKAVHLSHTCSQRTLLFPISLSPSIKAQHRIGPLAPPALLLAPGWPSVRGLPVEAGYQKTEK